LQIRRVVERRRDHKRGGVGGQIFLGEAEREDRDPDHQLPRVEAECAALAELRLP
jgi:hypothetical protein